MSFKSQHCLQHHLPKLWGLKSTHRNLKLCSCLIIWHRMCALTVSDETQGFTATFESGAECFQLWFQLVWGYLPWMCGGLTLAGCWVPTQPLSPAPGVPPGAAGASLSPSGGPGAPPALLLLSPPRCLQGRSSHGFPSALAAGQRFALSPPGFPRDARPWLQGWAVPCGGAAGARGNRLGLAQGSPGRPLQGLTLLLARGRLHQVRHACRWQGRASSLPSNMPSHVAPATSCAAWGDRYAVGKSLHLAVMAACGMTPVVQRQQGRSVAGCWREGQRQCQRALSAQAVLGTWQWSALMLLDVVPPGFFIHLQKQGRAEAEGLVFGWISRWSGWPRGFVSDDACMGQGSLPRQVAPQSQSVPACGTGCCHGHCQHGGGFGSQGRWSLHLRLWGDRSPARKCYV